MARHILFVLTTLAWICLGNVFSQSNTTVAPPTSSVDYKYTAKSTILQSNHWTSSAFEADKMSLVVTSSPVHSNNRTSTKDHKESDKEAFEATVTFYLLIACTALFAIILLFIVVLVVQLCRVQKSLKRKIPANSNWRWPWQRTRRWIERLNTWHSQSIVWNCPAIIEAPFGLNLQWSLPVIWFCHMAQDLEGITWI